MRSRPPTVTVAASLLVLLSLFDFPWPYMLLFPGAAEPPAFVLYSGYVGGAGGAHGARCSPQSGYRGRGGSGSAHHRAGSASLLPACFGRCPTTFFARKVSRVSEKKASRIFVNRDNPPRTGLFTEVPRRGVLRSPPTRRRKYAIGGATILRHLLLSKWQAARGVLHAPIRARLAVAAS